MAIIPTTEFPGKVAAADAEYPYGKARNISAPGDGTGTPFRARLLNDVWGFLQFLLQNANTAPSGNPDTALVSQYANAVDVIANQNVGKFLVQRMTPTTVQANTWTSAVWSDVHRQFVMVASTGTNRVITSPDGITWTNRTASAAVLWQGLAFAPTIPIYVAVGGNSVMTSPDGITWTNRTCPVGQWTNVVWSPQLGLFVAVENNEQTRVMTSPDGITWTGRTAPPGRWGSIAWSPQLGLFAATAFTTGTNYVMTSPDGVTWTARTAAENTSWREIVWAAELGLFVAVGGTGVSTYSVMTSPDGITWTGRVDPAGIGRGTIGYSPDYRILISGGSDIDPAKRFMYSFNGVNWFTTPVGISGVDDLNAIAYSSMLRRFVIGCTNSSTTRALYSI